MSVRDVESIDYVGVNILFKKVHVGIFDELDWQDESQHRKLLIQKIDHCIRHIRSGRLLANYPKIRGYEIVIEYVSMHPMPQASLEFWKTREGVIRQAGFKVHTRGVDVRGSLGLKFEEAAEPEQPALDDLVEPAPLILENTEVLDADPLAGIADFSDVAFLPPPSSKPRNRHILPVLTRLSVRRAAAQ
jgi:hypothetical protein